MKKSWKMNITRDSDGFVTSMSIPDDFLEVSDEELKFLDANDDDEDDDGEISKS